MGDWSSVDANQLLPADVIAAVRGMASLASAQLSSIKETLDSSISFPSLPDVPNPSAAVASALVDALENLLNGTKIHTLVVPIAKTMPAPKPPVLPATLDDMQAWLDVTIGTRESAAEAYQTLVDKNGGNAGFYKTFAQSLFDGNDPNRPQFYAQSDAVTMAVVLAGASSYASIAQAASMFDQLFKPKGAGGTMARTVPTPQNVTAKPVASATGSRIAVRVAWDPPSDVVTLPYFPGVRMTVLRYAVVRLSGPSAASAQSVLDVFPTQDLTEGMSSKNGTVVAIGSGRNASYVDTSPPDDGLPAYYGVAWEVSVQEPSGTTTLKFDKLSPIVKVSPTAPPPAQTGSPPNWTAFGAAADAFPSLAATVQKLLVRARSFIDGKPKPSSRLSAALDVAVSMAERLEARATDLLADVERLQTSLSRPLPALYVTRMTSGTGGNAFLMSELAARLGDVADPTRPPFDHGEYVCGVCFVAGAPRLADIAAAIAFLDALFGPATSANPLLGILEAIDTAVTAEEASVFDPSMQPMPPDQAAEVDPLTGQPPPPSAPVMSDSGAMVPSDSPENPNQGDTNVIPTSELC